MLKKINISRVVLGSKQEREIFTRKMKRYGWTLVKSEEGVGFFLRMEFLLKFELYVDLNENEETMTVCTIITKDDLYSYKKRSQLFRHKIGSFKSEIASMEKQGWRPKSRSYKKYRDQNSEIKCSIEQLMVRKID